MKIESSLVNRAGDTLRTIHTDIDYLDQIVGKHVDAVQAYAFYGDKLVVAYSTAKNYWTPPGGGVEAGESVVDALAREVLEETNMRILSYAPIGTLEIFESGVTKFQVRFACVVEPVGEFVSDVDGHEPITEIRLINPAKYKTYFDWGEIGDHLIKRALGTKDELLK